MMNENEFIPPYGWRPLEFGRYRKFVSAFALAAAEGVALWNSAPAWLTGLILALIPTFVVAMPNDE